MRKPTRIQLSRKKGWRMPPNTVKVDRSTMWGNHAAYRLKIATYRNLAVEAFRKWVENEASDSWKERAAIDLKGKNLACWCPLDQPCHVDVLLEIANR
jgi:hypothetical protein